MIFNVNEGTIGSLAYLFEPDAVDVWNPEQIDIAERFLLGFFCSAESNIHSLAAYQTSTCDEKNSYPLTIKAVRFLQHPFMTAMDVVLKVELVKAGMIAILKGAEGAAMGDLILKKMGLDRQLLLSAPLEDSNRVFDRFILSLEADHDARKYHAGLSLCSLFTFTHDMIFVDNNTIALSYLVIER